MDKILLKSFSREELEAWILSIGEKKFRAAQLWSWLYQKNEADFERMTDLAKDFRRRLADVATAGSLALEEVRVSSRTGTRKYLWRLADGLGVESVYIPDGRRRTVCISSQVGCPLGCAFCATGTLGFLRNLDPFEIVEQVLGVWKEVGEKPTNLVVMGMGEPFLNTEAVIKALTTLNHPEGAAFGARHITLSTSGIVPQILRYAEGRRPFQLAISLNATSDAQRSEIMPINRIYPLRELLHAAGYYAQKSRRRLTFEYVLLGGFNDSEGDARRLRRLLAGLPCKINLIAYNPTGRFTRPPEERVRQFAEWLRPLSAPVTFRLSKGDDIEGACGQLALKRAGGGGQAFFSETRVDM